MSRQSEEHTVRSADGTRIGFASLGTGPPLVLVHGSVSARDAWLPVAHALAPRFTCHVVDRRGRGRSGDGAAYSLDREREDVEAVLDFAGPGAHLLGHSYGAVCALEAARRLSAGRLVLYEPPLRFAGAKAGEVTPGLRAAMERDEVDEALTLFLKAGPELSDAELSALRPTPLWKQMIELTPTLARELDAIDRLGGDLDRYRDVSVPTLLLVGAASSAHLKEASSGLQSRLPDARTVLLEGQAHIANLLAPDLVADAVAEFLLA